MDNPITLDQDAESLEIKAAVHECIAEIDRVRGQMKADAHLIEELKAETKDILSRLEVCHLQVQPLS